jgi:hypothetical protein
MKITDDYKAKIRLWAASPKVVPAPPPQKLPAFGSQRFESHAQMNAWKKTLLLKLAQMAPEHE